VQARAFRPVKLSDGVDGAMGSDTDFGTGELLGGRSTASKAIKQVTPAAQDSGSGFDARNHIWEILSRKARGHTTESMKR